jgi:hypothetical protein
MVFVLKTLTTDNAAKVDDAKHLSKQSFDCVPQRSFVQNEASKCADRGRRAAAGARCGDLRETGLFAVLSIKESK